MHIPLKTALTQLKQSGKIFEELFNHCSLSIEIYKPFEKDFQQPHEKDEAYIIISGEGEFINGNKIIHFAPGDFLFVPAGIEHRFINFSSDFVTWVIFYGPKGGEKNEEYNKL